MTFQIWTFTDEVIFSEILMCPVVRVPFSRNTQRQRICVGNVLEGTLEPTPVGEAGLGMGEAGLGCSHKAVGEASRYSEAGKALQSCPELG